MRLRLKALKGQRAGKPDQPEAKVVKWSKENGSSG
jgi:hypothetical protein